MGIQDASDPEYQQLASLSIRMGGMGRSRRIADDQGSDHSDCAIGRDEFELNHQQQVVWSCMKRKLKVGGFLLARATSKAAPSWLAALGLGDPSLGSGNTIVVSTANCAPLHYSVTRPQRSQASRSMSCTNTFVATRAPTSLQTCAAAHSRGNLLFPNTPASSRLRDGGQTRPVGGHIGKCGATFDTRATGKAGGQSSLLEVGGAVSAAETKGPCWETSTMPSEKRGHTTWVENPSSNCLVACCCQPCRGRLGSGSSRPSGGVRDNSVQDGTTRPSSVNEYLH